MSVELEYTSKEDAIKQLQTTEDKVNVILDDNMEAWMFQIVIPEMIRVAKSMNLPTGFINGISFRKTGKNTGRLINTWSLMQKPLAKWFNWGTRTHWIQPVIAKVLSWIYKHGGRHATAIHFQASGLQPGMRLFSKGHYVSGIQRSEAMEFGIRIGKKRLIEQLPQLIEEQLK